MEAFSELDSFIQDSIERIIVRQDQSGISPTLKEIYEAVRHAHPHFPYGKSHLHLKLRAMGYAYKTLDHRMDVKNSERIRRRRVEYMSRIARLRTEVYRIVYLHETWYDSHDVKRKGFTNGRHSLTNAAPSRGKRIIILHAGTEEGFVDGCLYLATKNMKDAMADYHENMTVEVFERWLRDTLLPNLERQFPGERCAILLDNASYHSRLVEGSKIPTQRSTRAVMRAFMATHGIPEPPPCVPPGRRQPRPPTNAMLFEAIRTAVRERDIQQSYVVDEIIAGAGHAVARLPPYHCEFNPIEHAWSVLKRMVHKRNRTPKLGASVVILIRRVERWVLPEHWRGFCRKSRRAEEA
ncbi:hypothetical protein ONE63_011224 [Megalurothrips usitatus]|uniref:Tc1-like transposase DDE domain-containing protein n=1 Tax=Megalurothrips usitatus TaxID=439358 RepID=A0AAV7X319_9NEOP|nr:hypothetical protein ONE63_011224 [Megalurothrips usitatus]